MVLTRRQTEQIAATTNKTPDEVLKIHTQSSFAEKINGKMNSEIQKTPVWVYVLLFLFAGLSLLTIPQPFHPVHGQEPTILHVFYYGWLTALSTGLGALPFLLFPDIQSYWVGISNGTYTCSCTSKT